MKNIKRNLRVVNVFITFMFIFIMNLVTPITKSNENPYTQRLFLACFGTILLVTIYMIFKTKQLEKKDVIIAILFGLIAGIENTFTGLITATAFIGLTCMLRYSNVDVPIFKEKTFKGIIKSTGLVIIFGVVLGIINLLFGLTQYKLAIQLLPSHLTNALRAGISEEIAL